MSGVKHAQRMSVYSESPKVNIKNLTSINLEDLASDTSFQKLKKKMFLIISNFLF
jgi:hypothetical protein